MGTVWADLIIEVIDAIVIGLISGNDLASDIFFTGKDLSDLLTNLELHSEIELRPIPGSGKSRQCQQRRVFYHRASGWTKCVQVDPELRL